MKLLFDENLSPKLAASLTDLFPGSSHVHECGLGAAADLDIWRYAAREDFVLVSKDTDFYNQSMLRGAPPKWVWLRTGNCTVARLEQLLRTHAAALDEFAERSTDALLVLS